MAPAFKRILLKLSGEALMGELDYGTDPERLSAVVAEVLGDSAVLGAMSAEARSLAHPNAGKEIAEMAKEITGNRE